jgi:hypothetical protein
MSAALSSQPVIAEGMILGLIDGLMAALTLVMMFVYSIPLGTIACAEAVPARRSPHACALGCEGLLAL